MAVAIVSLPSFNCSVTKTVQEVDGRDVGSSLNSAVFFSSRILRLVFCSSVNTFLTFFAFFAAGRLALAAFFVPVFLVAVFFSPVFFAEDFFVLDAVEVAVFLGRPASAKPLAKTAAMRIPLGTMGAARGASCAAMRLAVRIDSPPPTRTCRAVARPIEDHMTSTGVCCDSWGILVWVGVGVGVGVVGVLDQGLW